MPRFYAQHTITMPLFASRHSTSWQVFDHQLGHEQNPEGVVAVTINRHWAYKIRDALNAAEKDQ